MKKIYLIDGNSFIYRMFFALPEFATKDGKIVNAIFGMAKFFVHSLVKQNPDYLIFLKDAKGKNFRHDIYTDYKATRDRMPDNLRTQISDIEKMIGLMGIDIIEIEGYEADDVIGTLANNLGKNKDNDIYILSGDKDLYSLITDNVSVYDTMKRKIFNPKKAEEKFGVKPNMIIDYLAIVGDKADNIPGIDGFGPKKAVGLINHIGGVEEVYKEVKKVVSKEKSFKDFDKSIQSCFKGKTFEKLLSSKDNAFLSKKLATIIKDINLDEHMLTDEVAGDGIVNKKFELEDFKFKPHFLLNDNIKEYFRELEFFSLIGEVEDIKVKTWSDFGLKVKTIVNKKELDDLYNKIKKSNKISLDTETTSLKIIDAELVGVSIYIDDNNIYYINRLHKAEAVNDNYLQTFLKNVLDLDILIIGHNIKYDLEIIELFLGNNNMQQSQNDNIGQMVLEL
ncbi:MAG: 5'-3' exonuclease H3TH domain-containing protein [Candidatus Gracilibacteria bacterium]